MASSDAVLKSPSAKAPALATPSPARAEWVAGWPLVMAASAGMSLASVSTYSIGIMIPAIEAELGWSRALITSGPAIVSFVAMTLSAFMGLIMDRLGARPVALISATLLCAALALMSQATNEPYLWWGLWVLVGLASSAMPTVWTLPVNNRFAAGRGLALAVTLSGTGIGASVVPLVAGYCVIHYGWRTGYLALGTTWALLALPLIVLFFRDRPAPAKTASAAAKPVAASLPGLSVREGFRSPAFYKLAFAAFAITLAGTALLINLVPMLMAADISRAAAIAIAGTTGIATIVGRIVGGYLMDRYSARLLAVVVTLCTLVLPIALLASPGSTTIAAAAVIVFCLTSGPKMTAIIYLTGRHLGQRSFGTLFGAIHVLLAMGVGLGPLLANLVYDHAQSYTPVFWIIVPVLMAGAWAFWSLGSYPAEARGDTPIHQPTQSG